MTLKIYGRRSSANVQKVVWLCCEANLKFDTENFGGKYGGTKSNEFKSIQKEWSSLKKKKIKDFTY